MSTKAFYFSHFIATQYPTLINNLHIQKVHLKVPNPAFSLNHIFSSYWNFKLQDILVKAVVVWSTHPLLLQNLRPIYPVCSGCSLSRGSGWGRLERCLDPKYRGPVKKGDEHLKKEKKGDILNVLKQTFFCTFTINIGISVPICCYSGT